MLSSKDLYNKRVYVEGNKSYGRIRAFLFIEKTCIGFSIKRPDLLWMFHRKPAFVSLKDIQINKNQITVKKSKSLSKDNKLIKSAINWQEIPVTFNEQKLGIVDRIDFDAQTGDLISIGLSQGVVSGAVLGKSEIKAKDIIGYSDKYKAVMLKDGASIYETKKGLAEKAGKATSVVVHKVKKTSPKVINSMQEQSDKIHNMFHEFKDEVKRGMQDNEQE